MIGAVSRQWCPGSTRASGDATEIRACVEAGIDLLTVWDDQIDEARAIAPEHFMGTGTTWGQYATPEEILRSAIRSMEKGVDMYYTLRSFDVVEMLAKEGIPVQGHMGLIPSVSVWSGGLRAFGRPADEAMQIGLADRRCATGRSRCPARTPYRPPTTCRGISAGHL